ncbi:hypothetical protein BLNAU_17921 [Blattamonas nauphoetae]|uniref:Uncharacterized protein n=1 Tax=Blattamonas nauphoetae TaxID=2049346 RepID=A0ABQ9X629_9EUKA|nr:hypothetical protein BLNAU_17921 [Blattamonas nauphoetae]
MPDSNDTNEHTIPSLLEQLQNEDQSIVHNALLEISALCQRSSPMHRINLVRLNGVDIIISFLQTTENTTFINIALIILLNVATLENDEELNVAYSGFLDLIPSLFQIGDLEIMKNIIWCLANVSATSSDDREYICSQTSLLDKFVTYIRLDTPFLHPLLFFYRNMLNDRESGQIFNPILIPIQKLVSSMTDYSAFLSIPRIDSTILKSPLDDAMSIIHGLIGPIFDRTRLLMESSFLTDCKKFLTDPRYALEHYAVTRTLYRLTFIDYPDVSPSYIADLFESSSTAATVFHTLQQSSLTIQDGGSDGVFFFCLRMIVNLICSSDSLALSFLNADLITILQNVLSNVHQKIYTEIMYVFTNLSDCSVDVVLKTLITGNIPCYLAHFLGRITNAHDLATLLCSVERFAIISKRSAQISEIAHLQLDSTFFQQAAESDLPNMVSSLISHKDEKVKHFAEKAFTALTNFEK